jgi:hypothetical protein
MGAALVEGPLGYTPPMPTPTARLGLAFELGGTEASLDLTALVPELSFVEGLAAVLADDEAGCGMSHWHRVPPGCPVSCSEPAV